MQNASCIGLELYVLNGTVCNARSVVGLFRSDFGERSEASCDVRGPVEAGAQSVRSLIRTSRKHTLVFAVGL